MAASWYSVVEDELSSVSDILDKEVRAAYPELNDMCESIASSEESQVLPAFNIVSYRAFGGSDVPTAVYMASCFQSAFDGLHLHDRIDGEGKVIWEKRSFFSKVPSTTKVIVAGDFMYVMGFRIAYSKVPKMVPFLTQASGSISDAIFKIVDASHNPDMTEEMAMDILIGKEAVEFRVLMESAASLAGADEGVCARARECGEQIGMAIGIAKDIDDIHVISKKKLPMERFAAGYPSLLAYYAMKDESSGKRIRELFSRSDLTKKDLLDAGALIKGTDAIQRCEALKDDCKKRAKELLSGFTDSRYRDALAEFVDSI